VRRALIFLALAACDDPEPRDIRLDLHHRPSCGYPQSYEIDCVGTLEVRTVDSDGNVLATSCTNISDDYPNLYELLSTSAVVPVLGPTAPERDIRIEVRGYNTYGVNPCLELTPERLILWGSSTLVDVTNTAVDVIDVAIECRPDCDCLELQTGSPTCPPETPVGACGPIIDTLACLRRCNADTDCYGGRLVCSGDPAVCTNGGGLMCSDCAASGECLEDGLCVNRVEPSSQPIDENMCALQCPPRDGSAPCPDGMTCRRIDGTRYTRLP
jgi:hypothetical protein